MCFIVSLIFVIIVKCFNTVSYIVPIFLIFYICVLFIIILICFIIVSCFYYFFNSFCNGFISCPLFV